MRHRFRPVVAAALWAVCPGSPVSAERPHAVSLPSPRLTFRGTETYEANGFDFVRYQYDVTNKGKYAKALFAPSPDLPACGENSSPSRAAVEIFDTTHKRITEFCALPAPEYLGRLWFAVAKGTPPPTGVYVEITDRLTGAKTRSNVVPVPSAP
jgi:hypothetical protein